MKNEYTTAEGIIRDMERTTPYTYEGLYGNFLRNYMESDKSRWTSDLSKHLFNVHSDWVWQSGEVADLLWERFEKRISC